MTTDIVVPGDTVSSEMRADALCLDQGKVVGHFDWMLADETGNLIDQGGFDNLVTTVGKNAMETLTFNGSSYTAANFMGLISSASFSAVAAADTMSSHAGWLEAGNANNPHYSGNRATMTFGSASSGTIISTGNAFVFTNSGTVQGAFTNINGGNGTIDNTSGVLFSAGTLSAAQPVISGNTITIGYTLVVS